MSFDPVSAKAWVDSAIEAALPSLSEFIAIPNLSRAFNPSWQHCEHAGRAVQHLVNWVRAQQLENCTVEVVQDEGYSQVILTEIAGDSAQTVLLYGHFDKQPPMEGWS
jgi:acetylornithine deacetylase/succinyl-diaminopimelate desuccinylase-like protein